MAVAEREITSSSRPPVNLRAAAVRLDEATKTPELMRQVKRHEEWQTEAWGYYDEIGEVHYAANVVADALARGRLFVGVRPEPEADLVPVGDPESGVSEGVAAAAEAKLRELRSPIGGQEQLLRQAAINSMVPGEWYLVRGVSDELDADAWYVRSTADVKVDSSGKVNVKGMANVTAEDVSRVWQPHPQRFESADSGMRAVLGQCETILLVDRQFRASLRSRLFAGILLLPNELREGKADPSAETAGDGEATDDPVLHDLIVALTTAIQNEGSASAVVPNVLTGEGASLQYARLLSLGQQIDPEVVALREATLRRIAQGIDIPPEIVLGVADLNHWSTWWVGESFAAHIEPKATFLADAFTQVFLRPELSGEIDAAILERLEVGLDLDALKRRPNVDEDAKAAYERWAISSEALRRSLGFDEADAPDEDELVERVALTRGIFTAELTAALLRRSVTPDLPETPSEEKNREAVEQSSADDIADGPPALPVAAAAANPGAALVAIDAALTERLFAATRAAFKRALEKAGNRALRKLSASSRKAFENQRIPPAQIVNHAGPTLLAAANVTEDELLDGALEDLRADFDRWTTEAQDAALAMVVNLIGADDVDAESVAELRTAQESARADAWEWFAAAAGALLADRLRDGQALADWEVRALVRQSLARAGGATELAPISDPVTVPEGAGAGLSTGPLLLGLLAVFGIGVASWEWIHGEPATPFPEHLELHGDRAATEDGFGGNAPGDHKGCTCALQPILTKTEGSDE